MQRQLSNSGFFTIPDSGQTNPAYPAPNTPWDCAVEPHNAVLPTIAIPVRHQSVFELEICAATSADGPRDAILYHCARLNLGTFHDDDNPILDHKSPVLGSARTNKHQHCPQEVHAVQSIVPHRKS